LGAPPIYSLPLHAALPICGGAAGGLAFFLLSSFSVSSGLAAGVFFFTLIGGAVALLGKKGDRRAKRWAAQYPWKFAGAPALLGALGVAAVSLVFSGLGAAIF